MSDPTQAELEQIAEAVCDASLWPGAWLKMNDVEAGQCRHIALAAWRVIEPLCRERAAKVAEELKTLDCRTPTGDRPGEGGMSSSIRQFMKLAAAIRKGSDDA